MTNQKMIELMIHQADSLRIIGAAMLDYSLGEGDEWHTHGVELQGAAGQIEGWVETLDAAHFFA